VGCCREKSIIFLEGLQSLSATLSIGATLEEINKRCEKYVLEIRGVGDGSFYILVKSKVCKLERGFGGL
jgi:hypothetical protein